MIRSIALYLPQFHPIPENDEWWGKGFTEWTNVTRAKPLFKGHWQPRLPADLGYYDLRVSESREAQATLARQYGIAGFCYWHYWFGGKRIIERPFVEVVKTGKPDFPFCIAWANQTWSGTWHGLSNKRTLIEQVYPGIQDYTDHFYSLLDAFTDNRYIEVNGRKLVFVFRPMEIPEPKKFIDTWQELAINEGLKGIHFVGMHMKEDWDPFLYGFNAMVEFGPMLYKMQKTRVIDKLTTKAFDFHYTEYIRKSRKIPLRISYPEYVRRYPDHILSEYEYPLIYPSWDNTPRSKHDGWLFENSSPELFGILCEKAFQSAMNKKDDERIVIIKSWNEWAEGNYLEPDSRYGLEYLEAFKKALVNFNGKG